MFPRLFIENFGPFEKINLEIKSLTLFIGRNSVGKSMILCLL
ncbi:MAG: AAA family ATPase [Crenarchaeota archaeon]|nr:AAA family ATPase [Thermoproteota archaeon]